MNQWDIGFADENTTECSLDIANLIFKRTAHSAQLLPFTDFGSEFKIGTQNTAFWCSNPGAFPQPKSHQVFWDS